MSGLFSDSNILQQHFEHSLVQFLMLQLDWNTGFRSAIIFLGTSFRGAKDNNFSSETLDVAALEFSV